MKLCVLVLACVALVGCPQPVVPTPEVDADPVDAAPDPTEVDELADAPRTPVSRACSTLRKLRCPEGDQPDGGQTCTQLMQHVVETNLVSVNPGCIADAKTAKAARACSPKYVTCPGQP